MFRRSKSPTSAQEAQSVADEPRTVEEERQEENGGTREDGKLGWLKGLSRKFGPRKPQEASPPEGMTSLFEWIRKWVGIPAALVGVVAVCGAFVYVQELRGKVTDYEAKNSALTNRVTTLEQGFEQQGKATRELKYQVQYAREDIFFLRCLKRKGKIDPSTLACNTPDGGSEVFRPPFPDLATKNK